MRLGSAGYLMEWTVVSEVNSEDGLLKSVSRWRVVEYCFTKSEGYLGRGGGGP